MGSRFSYSGSMGNEAKGGVIMRKILLVMISILVLSISLSSLSSDDSNAEGQTMEHALMTDIYRFEAGSDIRSVHPMCYEGWAEVFIFSEGSSKEQAFLVALNNRENVLNMEDDGLSTSGNKILYIVAIATSVYMTIDEEFIVLGQIDIYASADAIQYIPYGSVVNIQVSDYSSGIVFKKGSKVFELHEGYNEFYVGSSGDYRVATTENDGRMYVSYTLDYNYTEKKPPIEGWICVGVALLSLIPLIWFGRPQKIA